MEKAGENGMSEKGRKAHGRTADINEKLIVNLRELGHIMRLLSEGKASRMRVLIFLLKAGRITQGELAERLGVQPASASEVLTKLEGAGLLVRTPNEADRRAVDVCLTESGRAEAEEALRLRRKRREDMFASLSAEQKDTLLSLLETLRADWERYRDERAAAECT